MWTFIKRTKSCWNFRSYSDESGSLRRRGIIYCFDFSTGLNYFNSWLNQKASLATSGGSLLKQCYSAHRCTPSRASFLTGRYAFRFGLGSDAISKGKFKNKLLKKYYLKSLENLFLSLTKKIPSVWTQMRNYYLNISNLPDTILTWSENGI